MGFSNDILTILFNYSAGYKQMRKLLYTSRPSTHKYPEQPHNSETLYVTLGRLKKKGLVAKEHEFWKITEKGKEYFQNKLGKLLPNHSHRLKSSSHNKQMIIIFDIPEKYRRKRDWLRTELTLLDFCQLQKSVWFGPVPLPKSFLKNLHDLNILQYLKFFKAREEDVV